MTTTPTKPNTEANAPMRIYVASLADYNAGDLHGVWLDVTGDPEPLRAGIAAMLARSRQPYAEEWAIHDHEGFGRLSVGEYEDLDTLCRVASAVAEHGEVFLCLLHHLGGVRQFDEAMRYMDEGYAGRYDSTIEHVEQWYDEVYGEQLKELPSEIRYAIHWQDVADELEMSGDIFVLQTSDHHAHVFYAHL